MSDTQEKTAAAEVVLPPKQNELIVTEDNKTVATRGDPGSSLNMVLDMIRLAITNPAVDVAKVDVLRNMVMEAEDRENERGFDIALSNAQSEMEPIRATLTNKATTSKYASHAQLDGVLRPIYTGHGFSLSYGTAAIPSNERIPEDGPMVRVVCRVSRFGAHRNYQMDLPADGKGAKGGDVMTRTHAAVAATSYGVRVLERLIFNLPVIHDNDGNSAGAKRADVSVDDRKINAAQIKRIKTMMETSKADSVRFLEFMSVAKVEDILADHFNKAIDMLEKKRRSLNKKGKTK